VKDAQKVVQAFETFKRSYLQAVNTDLVQPSTLNTAQFNTDVATAFSTLSSGVTLDIQNVVATNSTLTSTVQGQLTTLQTQLGAVTLPATANPRAIRTYERQVLQDINQTEFQMAQKVRLATPPAGSVSGQMVSQTINQVVSAFQTFTTAYFNAVQSDLLAAGTTNPSANKAQFDQDVTTALSALNTSMTGALNSSLPSALTGTLNTTISSDINGASTTPPSLQTNLLNIALPQSTNLFPLLLFRLESSFTIARGENQVLRDIVSAVSTFNSNLGR
jgi:hypothetical protein